MIKHIVLFKFKPEATQTQKEDILEALNQLPKGIQEIKGFSSGLKGPFRCTHEVGIVVDFDGPEGLNAYLPHPVHKNLVGKLQESGIVDMTSVASLDYEV